MQVRNRPQPTDPSRLEQVTDTILLTAVLSLTVLRSTYIENPHVDQMQTQFFLSSELVSLLMSTAMLLCFAVWLLIRLVGNRLSWRRTWLGAGIGLFLAAGLIGCLAASNKRAALTDLTVLMTPMLSAMLLVQLLTSARKIQAAVLLVMAVGVMMTAQCIDQAADSNAAVIRDYERDPGEQLEQLNIEPDSLEHWMYEHRLYSKDIRGFLMTSNSAASFFLLAGFAGIGLCLQAFRRRQQTETFTALAGYVLATVLILLGLLLTQSKGGLGAFAAGLLLLGCVTLFGRRLWRHRLAVGLTLAVLIIAATAGIVAWGTAHGRLPGGNSLLVRWQYWQSSVRMIGDHLLTGVGGGNFRFLYPQYKAAAASETIQDPHNFVLSLLSQYGPLGLAGFAAAILWPVYGGLKRYFGTDAPVAAVTDEAKSRFFRVAVGLLGLATGLLLFIRPMLVDTNFLYQQAAVRSAAYVVLYLFPAAVFILAFGVLIAAGSQDGAIPRPKRDLVTALVCGIAAVLIHNLVDFALFEMGVWNILWLLTAVLIAACRTDTSGPTTVSRLSGGKRALAGAAFIAVLIAYFGLVLIPPLKANRLFNRALMARTPPLTILEQAVAADPLAPDTAYTAAALLRQVYASQSSFARDNALLKLGADLATIAQQRNPASFKPYRMKADLLLMLAQADTDAETAYLEKAYEALSEALERYPGSDRIHFQLGQVAEELDRPAAALAHYQQAVAIELAYREQFKLMYPKRRPVISRLGNTDYTIARSRIEQLQKQLDVPDDVK